MYDIERFRVIIYGLTAGLIALQCLSFLVIFVLSLARTSGDTTKDEAGRGTGNDPGTDGEEMTPPPVRDGLQNKGYNIEGAT